MLNPVITGIIAIVAYVLGTGGQLATLTDRWQGRGWILAAGGR